MSPTRYPMRTTTPATEIACDLSSVLTEWIERSGPRSMYRTCASCRQMVKDGSPAHCNLFNATPPVDVIVNGCDKYEDEAEIPL